MCLAVPARILRREGSIGVAERSGLEIEVDLSLLPEAKVGDCVIVHVGIGLSVLDEQEARESLEAHGKALNPEEPSCD